MKHVVSVVVIALALVASCGKSKSKLDTGEDTGKAGADGKDDCAAAVAKITDLQVAANLDQIPAAEQAEFKEMLGRIGDAIAASCRETKWPKEVTDCMKAVTSANEIAPCQHKLSNEQNQAAEKAAQQAAVPAPKPASK